MRKTLSLIVVLLLILGTMGIASAEAPAPKAGGTFIMSAYFDPPPALNFNPTAPSGNPDSNEYCFERLFDYVSVPNPIFRPRMAESFTSDGETTTVFLRDNLKWSDGSALTSADIKNSYLIRFLSNDRVWKYLEKIDTPDDTTVVFTWKTVSSLNNILLFNQAIQYSVAQYGKWAEEAEPFLADRIYDEVSKEFKNSDESNEKVLSIREDLMTFKPLEAEALFNSAYKAASSNASEITLDKNEFYWNADNVYVDHVRVIAYVSAESFLANVQAGLYTSDNHGTPPDVYEEIMKIPDLRFGWLADLGQPAFNFNMKKDFTMIPEVRKAINYAVDRIALLEIAEPGTLTPDLTNSGLTPMWHSVVPQSFIDELTVYDYDPDAAIAELESIGWTKGGDGYFVDENGAPVTIEVASMNSWPIYFICGDAIVDYLKEIGLNASFNAMELSAYWTYIDQGSTNVLADFRGGCPRLGPWEAYYNLIYESYDRMGFMTRDDFNAQKDIILTMSDGTEVNTTEQINILFSTTDNDEYVAATQVMMKLFNDQCYFMPIGEKYMPYRCYDPSFVYPDYVEGSPDWFGTGPNTYSRWLAMGQAYFAE